MKGARAIWVLLRRELLSYCVSPVVYVVLIAFLGLSGWNFFALLNRFLLVIARDTSNAEMFQQMPHVFNVNMDLLRGWFNMSAQFLLFLSPAISMRLLAEERGTGRIDLLLSAPITDFQLIFGKFLAGVALCVLLLLPTAVYPALLFWYGSPELGQILSGYMGMVLLSLAVMSVGLVISSLTSSQIVAAVATLGIVMVLWLVGVVGTEGSLVREIFSSISLMDHFSEFSSGIIALKNIVFYVSFAAFMLFLSLRAVESQRWRG